MILLWRLLVRWFRKPIRWPYHGWILDTKKFRLGKHMIFWTFNPENHHILLVTIYFEATNYIDAPIHLRSTHQINGMIIKSWNLVVQTRWMALPYISIFWNSKDSIIQERETAYLTRKLSKREKRTVQVMFFDPSSIFTIWNW